jgi:flagellar hook assembly protein FlgD
MADFRSQSGVSRNVHRQPPRSGLNLPPLVSLAAIAAVILLVIVMFPLDWLRVPGVSLITDQTILSPNQDGSFDQVAVFYTLTDQATVSVQVVNGAGQVVRTLVREQEQPAGQHTTAWDGRDEGGNVLPDGRYTIRALAGGPARSSEQSTTITIDNTPPLLVMANFLPSQTTRQNTFNIEGTTEVDATVWVNDDPFPITVDGNGIFRTTRQLVEGSNPITVRAVDSAGNQSQAQTEVVLRTTAPLLTLNDPAPESWLRDNIVTVAGVAPPDAEVTINGQPATLNERGEFALDVVLQEGDNSIRAVASDEVGNTTSEERIVHVRTRGPSIVLANVPEGLIVSDPSLRVSGQVDPGSTLTVNGSVTPIDNRGVFNAIVALRSGQNVISVSATDRAGNVTTVQRGVVYDAAAPLSSATPLARAFDGETLFRLLAGAGLIIIIGLIVVGWRRPVRIDLSLNRTIFYPNQPGDGRLLVIRIRLSRDARLTMAVYDQTDRHVMTLCENRPYSSGDNQRLWDGQDASGRLLPDGIYQIEAIATAAWGKAHSAVWVSLDTSPAIASRSQREQLLSYLPSDEDLDE